MANKHSMRSVVAGIGLACALALPAGMSLPVAPATASEIKIVVNDQAVTSYDIARRVAFLKLQRRKGNLNKEAADELIDEALKRGAVQQAGYRIPDSQVDAAFSNFAKSNKMSPSKMTSILNQSGVTAHHFKEFIRLQIGWGQLIQAQSRSSQGLMNEQEAAAKMLEQGGKKPTSTEYTLQQVIFVVPSDKRGSQLARRRQEANNMRGRVNGCEGTYDLAKQLRDVTVRDLGRVLELRLPNEWAKDVKGLNAGQTTRVHDTERGAEFIIVCSARSVNDDRVAQLEFSTEQVESGNNEMGKKLLEQLRKNARIERR